MGQRLNIEIYKDGMTMLYANCYYHWSAYTMDSLLKLRDIVHQWNAIKNDKEKTKDELLLGYHLFCIDDTTYDIDEDATEVDENGKKNIKFKEVVRCAGLCEQSFRLMKLLFPKEEFKKGIDRNVGLISIHPNDVDGTRQWEEGRINVNLDTEEFTFDIYSIYEEEELKECFGIKKLEDIPTFPTDMEDAFTDGYLSFRDLPELIELVHESDFYKLSSGDFLVWFQ